MAPKSLQIPKTDRHPFILSYEDVANQLETNVETGLTARKVSELHGKVSKNVLDDGGGVAWYSILIKQISNAMILVG
jgi:Na+-exporting ATPase